MSIFGLGLNLLGPSSPAQNQQSRCAANWFASTRLSTLDIDQESSCGRDPGLHIQLVPTSNRDLGDVRLAASPMRARAGMM
jgi:hypothetical protein